MRKRERREITENIAEVAPTGATGRIRLLGTEQTAFRALHWTWTKEMLKKERRKKKWKKKQKKKINNFPKFKKKNFFFRRKNFEFLETRNESSHFQETVKWWPFEHLFLSLPSFLPSFLPLTHWNVSLCSSMKERRKKEEIENHCALWIINSWKMIHECQCKSRKSRVFFFLGNPKKYDSLSRN